MLVTLMCQWLKMDLYGPNMKEYLPESLLIFLAEVLSINFLAITVFFIRLQSSNVEQKSLFALLAG